MIYVVSNIDYDTDDKDIDDLPKELEIDVPDSFDEEDTEVYISDEISNKTGFCHKGFSTTPEIYL